MQYDYCTEIARLLLTFVRPFVDGEIFMSVLFQFQKFNLGCCKLNYMKHHTFYLAAHCNV